MPDMNVFIWSHKVKRVNAISADMTQPVIRKADEHTFGNAFYDSVIREQKIYVELAHDKITQTICMSEIG